MEHLIYLTLQLYLLCLCDTEALSSKNVLKYQVQEYETLDMTTYKITINLSSSLHVCDRRFLSVALGPRRMFSINWTEKLINLGRGLFDSEIRLGGTDANFLHFNSNGIADQMQSAHQGWGEHDLSSAFLFMKGGNFTLPGQQWMSFNEAISKVGWELLFDVNNFFWTSDGLWDPMNAQLLLNFSSARGVKIPYFQLGNEPNAYWGNFNFRISAETLVKDYKMLKRLISNFPLYASSKLCGPDVSNVGLRGSARIYFYDFIKAGAYDVLDEYSLHHYYCDSKTAKLEDFLSVVMLDSLKENLEQPLAIVRASPRPLPIRLTETSTCYGGGAGGMSDRYVAGFLWLDKLGLCAQYGISRVFRQTFFGATYALITNRQDPTPDYYLSVLFKRLVDGAVFNVSTDPINKNLRVYAHCARQGIYSAGALVIYYLNVGGSSMVLSLTQFKDADLDLYLLTPGDADNLTSKFVKLNGNTLLMPGETLPPMPAKPHKGDITVTAQSFGFIVVPHATVDLCHKYSPMVVAHSETIEDNIMLIVFAAVICVVV